MGVVRVYVYVGYLDGWTKQRKGERASLKFAKAGLGRASSGTGAQGQRCSHPANQLDIIMAPAAAAAAASNGSTSSHNSDLDFLSQVLSASSQQQQQQQQQQQPDWAAMVDGLKLSSGLSDASEEHLANLDEASVTALLQKLEQADVVSDAMERRLDALLGDLDGLLGGLAVPDTDSDSAQQQAGGARASEQEQEQGKGDNQETVDVNGAAAAPSPSPSADAAEQDDKV